MSTPADAQAPKPRNKLRKHPKRRPGSLISCSASPRPSTDTARTASPEQPPSPQAPGSSSAAAAHDPSWAPPLPPPDLSDAKWEGFVRDSSCVLPMAKSPRLEHVVGAALELGAPAPAPPAELLVPEFAHLALGSASPSPSSSEGGGLQPPSRSPRRPLSDGSHTRVPSLRSPSSSSTSTMSSSSSVSSASNLRKYAKTPVLRIGQLEAQQQQDQQAPLSAPPVPRRSARRSSAAEQMAAQYRSLLESQSCTRLRTDGDYWEAEAQDVSRQDSIETIRSAIARRGVVTPPSFSPSSHSSFSNSLSSPSSTSSPSSSSSSLDFPDAAAEFEGSPTSDGTLVGFEEDAIYFKPAFTMEGLSPIPEDESCYSPLDSPRLEMGGAGPGAQDDGDDATLSLQICVDLLGKELASALDQRRQTEETSGSGEGGDDDDGRGNSLGKAAGATEAAATEAKTPTSPLQVWLMIEAYERLRDQVATEAKTNNLSPGEAQSLEAMFDMWLRALYRVHEGITRAGTPWAGACDVPDEREVEALSTVDLD